MTINLDLTPEIENYLARKAGERGLSLEEYTTRLLTETVLANEKKTRSINLLQSWIDEEDGGEQQETGEYLIEVLDSDRLSDRPLFPPHLKGITW